MKPTSDDFAPRRDGWFEHRGTWGEVTVGTVLATEKRSERWEVIETAHGTKPIPYGYTLWFKIREQTTGQVHVVEPKPKYTPVDILTQNPADTQTPEPTEPSDAQAVMLLARELGAEVMASFDAKTGEVTCPDYVYRSHIEGHGDRQISRGLTEHLRVAHSVSVDDGLDIATLIGLHGQAHNPEWPNIGKGGFSHRHVPEDLSIMG